MKHFFTCFLFVLLFAQISVPAISQDTSSSPIYLYHPHRVVAAGDTSNNGKGHNTLTQDTLKLKHLRDSIAAREIFVRDSIAAREQFVRDSILQHQKILDSLKILQQNLPLILEAGTWLKNDQLIVDRYTIKIIGDSMLGDYVYINLPFSFNKPYIPWVTKIKLTSNKTGIILNEGKKVISFRASNIDWKIDYPVRGNFFIINESSVVETKNGKKYYKQLFDSVFYGLNGHIFKIKRYANIYQANDRYQRGNFLFSDLYEVKQFEYTGNNILRHIQIVNLCDRYNNADAVKVCSIVDYNISKENNSYLVTRQNNPANVFSDGKFNFGFDLAHNLKSVSFVNNKNTEKWKNTIELNPDGNVSRYIYEKNGKINNTLIFNYFLNDPGAKYKVEAISCSFEDDGISYFQQNLTTGKSRTRDHFTGEWGDWR